MWKRSLDGLKNSAKRYHELTSKCDGAAVRMDGSLIAQQIKNEIAETIRNGVLKPGLAVLQVGNRPQSQTYLQKLRAACTEVGIKNFTTHLPETAPLQSILQSLRLLNIDQSVHGIVVQLPLPKKIRPESVLQEISLDKDVDGLHPLNLGKLALQNFHPSFVPCTARACLELLNRYNIDLEQKKVVIVGCSNVVGIPTALLLQRHNATVTIVDKHTPGPAEIARTADILVAATGNVNLVTEEWIKPGAVVLDVGMNVLQEPFPREGYRFVGDVCYEEAEKVASAITPVPGGVGPVTITMVLANTLLAAQRLCKQSL